MHPPPFERSVADSVFRYRCSEAQRGPPSLQGEPRPDKRLRLVVRRISAAEGRTFREAGQATALVLAFGGGAPHPPAVPAGAGHVGDAS